MRYSRVRLTPALVFGLGALLLLSPVVSSDSDPGPASEPELLPMWEPSWSPHIVSSGFYGPPDTVQDFCTIDVDGDGVREMLALGRDFLHVFDVVDALGPEYRADMGDPYGWGGDPLDGQCIAAGDFDEDGLPDVAIGNLTNEILIFLQDSWPVGTRFSLHQILNSGRSVHRIWIHDQNADGHLDLMVPDRFDDARRLTVWQGDGQGDLVEAGVVTGIEGQIQSVVEAPYMNRPGFWIGTDKGVWFSLQGDLKAEKLIEYGGRGYLAAEDFDGNGSTDVAVAGARIHIFYGREEGFEELKLPIDSPVADWMDADDLDGDGDTDLVVGRRSPAEVTVYWNAAGAFAYGGSYGMGYDAVPRGSLRGACSDITGDGLAEVVIPTTLGEITCLSASTPGLRSPRLSPGGLLLGRADLDSDGAVEVLVNNPGAGLSAVEDIGNGWLNIQRVQLWDESGTEERAWNPFGVCLGDVNGDGIPELLGWDSVGLRMWQMTSNGWRYSSTHSLEGMAAPQIFAVDVDEDGMDEVVIARQASLMALGLTDSHGELSSEDSIDWGGPVGPLAKLARGDSSRIAGFLSGSDETRVRVVEGGRAVDLGLSLQVSVLSCAGTDVDGDNSEELAFVGLGVEGHGADLHLVAKLGVIAVDGTEGEIVGLWEVEDWIPGNIPFPYGGLVTIPRRGSPPSFLISVANSIVDVTGLVMAEPEWGQTTTSSSWLDGPSGPLLLPLDSPVESDTRLVSIPATEPKLLNVVEVER